jgi:hypothetical protein
MAWTRPLWLSILTAYRRVCLLAILGQRARGNSRTLPIAAFREPSSESAFLMRLTSLQRFCAAAAGLAVAGALIVTATPASAGDIDGSISPKFQVDSTTIPAHAASPRIIVADVLATGPFTNATVTFDFSGLAGVASATIDAGSHCTVSGMTASCPVADVSDGDQQDPTYKIAVVSDAKAVDGAKGSMSVTASADGLNSVPDTLTTDVVISDSSQLATSSTSPDEASANPGDPVSEPVSLANMGSKPAAGVEMVFEMSHGIVPNTYDNCLYANWSAIDGTYVACTIPGTIAAEQQMKLAVPFQGKISADAATFVRDDLVIDETNALTPTPPDSADFPGVTFVARPASGHVLSLVPEALDGTITGDYYSGGLTWGYRVENTFDLAARGAHVTGHVGDVVTATLGVTDNGPAVLDSWSSHNEAADVWFTVPGWATVVTVPVGCHGTNDVHQGPDGSAPGMAYYACTPTDTYYMAVGQTYSFSFGLRIKAAAGSDGIVDAYMYGQASTRDPITANNTAALTVTVATAPPIRIELPRGRQVPPPPGYGHTAKH